MFSIVRNICQDLRNAYTRQLRERKINWKRLVVRDVVYRSFFVNDFRLLIVSPPLSLPPCLACIRFLCRMLIRKWRDSFFFIVCSHLVRERYCLKTVIVNHLTQDKRVVTWKTIGLRYRHECVTVCITSKNCRSPKVCRVINNIVYFFFLKVTERV